MTTVALEARQLSKRFARRGEAPLAVLDGFSFAARAGEVVVVVGPNGAGKTTLLHLLAGLLQADAGEVRLDAAPGRPPVALVFQDYGESLLPWRTNLDNLALPLEVAGVPREVRHAQVRRCLAAWSTGGELLAELGIPAGGYPYTLSGGQRQWLAILRAYVANPAVVLLDEPFASLDVHGRLLAQARLAALHQQAPLTTVIVSHELDEAVYLADRVLVLSRAPARLVAEVAVTLPRPRPPLAAVLEDLRYAQLCRQVQAAFLKALGA